MRTEVNFSKRMEKGSNWTCVGRPIDATTAYIVDDSMQLVPKGTVGEICLAGPQLANGYLNREEAAAKVFVKNPFGEGRLYKTGDLAMENDDGFHIIGRKDYQLKIGGLKIVPEEITAALAAAMWCDLALFSEQSWVQPRHSLLLWCPERNNPKMVSPAHGEPKYNRCESFWQRASQNTLFLITG